MIIYNVTANIDKSIHTEWLKWIKEHIPLVLSTGKFTGAKFTKVLVEDEETETYSIQYSAPSRKSLDAYYADNAEQLRSEGLKRFADKMLVFRTELDVIDTYNVDFK